MKTNTTAEEVPVDDPFDAAQVHARSASNILTEDVCGAEDGTETLEPILHAIGHALVAIAICDVFRVVNMERQAKVGEDLAAELRDRLDPPAEPWQ